MARVIERVKGEDYVSFKVGEKILTIATKEVAKDLMQKLLVHGLNAKVGDAAAGAKTDAERIAAISQAIENLKRGVWREVSSGGTILAEAIARIKKLDIVEAQTMLDGLDDEAMATLQKHPAVKKAIAEIRAERLATAAKTADAADLDEILKL